jgi:hypothetical protein
MKEILHTPDSLLLPINKLLKSKRNLSWTKTCIPLTVLLLPSTNSQMSENLSWTKTCIPLDSCLLPSTNFSKVRDHERKLAYPDSFIIAVNKLLKVRETYHQYISVMNGWKALNNNLMKEILHTFDSYCRQQTLKSQRNLIWTKTCIPLTVLLPTNFKCKRSLSMNENLHVPLDSFIIAVNKLLKSKRNLSWTKTCIPL